MRVSRAEIRAPGAGWRHEQTRMRLVQGRRGLAENRCQKHALSQRNQLGDQIVDELASHDMESGDSANA